MSACSFYILYEASPAPSSPRVTFRHGARSGRIYPNWSDGGGNAAVARGVSAWHPWLRRQGGPPPSESPKASFRPHFC